MNPKRAYFLMIALVMLLSLGIFGAAYGVQGLLSGQSQKLVTLKAKLAGVNQQQTNLVLAKKEIASYTDLYNIAKVVVPESKDQAETVRQIVNIAAKNDVSLATITFPSSTLGSLAAGGSSASTTAPVLAAPPVNSKTNTLSQLTPVLGIVGVYDLQITVAGSSTGVTFNQLINFLHGLEQNRLTAQVSTVSITPSASSSSLFSFTLILNSYIKP